MMGFHSKALGELIPRTERRSFDERSEPRFDDMVERAVIYFRNEPYVVPVVNISARGTMIESGIQPRIGETIVVQFESCTRIQGFVRWAREGRIGINFGHELILS